MKELQKQFMNVNYTDDPVEIARRTATEGRIIQVVALGFPTLRLECKNGEIVTGKFVCTRSVISPNSNGKTRHGFVVSLQTSWDDEWIYDVDISSIHTIEGLPPAAA
jgi:hypothetical protein